MRADYWERACRELSAADPVMAGLVARYGDLALVSRGDPFGTLARSVVGQQISVRAADAVWGRFAGALGEVTPARVLATGSEGLQGCGLSRRKIEYLLDLAGHFVSARVDPRRWQAMDDEAVIAELENEMTEAAGRLEFERAALLRDQINALRSGDYKKIARAPKSARKGGVSRRG